MKTVRVTQLFRFLGEVYSFTYSKKPDQRRVLIQVFHIYPESWWVKQSSAGGSEGVRSREGWDKSLS